MVSPLLQSGMVGGGSGQTLDIDGTLIHLEQNESGMKTAHGF